MVEAEPRLLDGALQHAKIDDHAGCRIDFASHDNLGAIGVAVDPAARSLFEIRDRRLVTVAMKRVRQFKAKLLADFEHHGIPMSLCICTLNRQSG